MNTDHLHLHLRPLALAFLILGLLLLAPVFCYGQDVRLAVVVCKDEGQALAEAYALQRSVPAIPWHFRVKQVFRHNGSPSMLPIFSGKNYICVIEGIPFAQVRAGDVPVFLSDRSAREIVEWGRGDLFIMHPCVGRTATLLFTCGMDSIRNPNPPRDHPADQAQYVGVVRQTFHW